MLIELKGQRSGEGRCLVSASVPWLCMDDLPIQPGLLSSEAASTTPYWTS